MQLAGVLRVGAVAVFLESKASYDNLNIWFFLRGLRKVAIVAGYYDECSFGRFRVVKPQGFHRITSKEKPLAP
ncbi:hypothetical protein IPC618_27005 [Pseudomonas aeruginosa]|nr:hypothetical protein A4W92_07505 [Pseudomonas aeruginosa]ARH14261.1 hypothetical protein HW02_33760 [Pseudomonas aeruginosa]ARH14527.1 hypothetical protein HW01_32670 [Pseudomonas aeruginosa]ASD09641.1 hypothetical protein CD800_11210 [Pseudomonas aeruginosa]KAB0720611.1 hypothetical protein F7O91_15340 [Pseudomonas aeruginosa]